MAITLATLIATCAPLVHPTTLRAVIQVESGGNAYAVSINHPQSLRDHGIDPPTVIQPHSARTAQELTRSLLAHGFGVSVGLAQINVDQLSREQIDIAGLFDPCINLAVAQRVLLDCNANQSRRIALSNRQRLNRTLVCYNTGDYIASPRSHYVTNVRGAARRISYRHSWPTRSPV